jgi:FkbM family methyltransferase
MTQTTNLAGELDNILREDVASARQRERNAFDELVAPFGDSIVLFGAGNLGRQVLAQMRQDGIEPLAFSDNNHSIHGSVIDGLAVLSPREAATLYGQFAAFVVSIWNPSHSFIDTQAQLQELGCTKVVSIATFRWKHPDKFLPFLWANLPSKTSEEAVQVKSAFTLWADDFSRQEYLAQLQWRVWDNFDLLSSPVPQESYFPDDIFQLDPTEQFVDCGAYDGVTIRQFLNKDPSFTGRILAFEPDPSNFANLQRYVSSLEINLLDRLKILPYAVGARYEKVHFNATGTMGSCITDSGDIEVDCIPLDEAFQKYSFSPTYLKMDIEGAELDALIGAEKTICQRMPVLAICVYHRYDDLWRIPSYLHSLSDEYSIFLRPHEIENWQLVCYAVPKKRLANVTN